MSWESENIQESSISPIWESIYDKSQKWNKQLVNKQNYMSLCINPSMMLGFTFQSLPRMEEFKIYSTFKYINYCKMH